MLATTPPLELQVQTHTNIISLRVSFRFYSLHPRLSHDLASSGIRTPDFSDDKLANFPC